MAELNDKLITYGNLSTFHDNLINDSVTSGNSTWSSEKIASEIQQGGGGGGSTTIENVTYAQLKAKRDNSQLVKGQQYRITDYVTMANSDTTPVSSAEHPFDLIVTAIDVNKLSETGVKAVKKANDDYFVQNETLNRWRGYTSTGEDLYLYTEERYFPNASAGTCTIGYWDGKIYYTTKYDIVGVEYVDSEIGDIYINPDKVVLYIDENEKLVFGDSPYNYLMELYLEGESEYTLEEIEWFNGKYFVDAEDSAKMEMKFDSELTYTVNSRLDAWEVKYCLDNDKTRFDWAQIENQGLGFSAIKVNGSKGQMPYYYIDYDAYKFVENGTITDNGVTYYKWYEENKDLTVLTTQATYSNQPSGEDENGCTYYNTVYDIVGEITIDDESFDKFYKDNKHIIMTDTVENDGVTHKVLVLGDNINCNGDGPEEGNFLYKRYSSGDTQDSYAWIYVKNSNGKEINDTTVVWDDVDSTDIIYTSSLNPSAGTFTTGYVYEVLDYNSNVQYVPAGKGVIYYLKDEFNNVAEYDFKNIVFDIKCTDVIKMTLNGNSNTYLYIRYPSSDSDMGTDEFWYAYKRLNNSQNVNIEDYYAWGDIDYQYVTFWFTTENLTIGSEISDYDENDCVIIDTRVQQKGYKFTFGNMSNSPKDDTLNGNSNNNIIQSTIENEVRFIPVLDLGDNKTNYGKGAYVGSDTIKISEDGVISGNYRGGNYIRIEGGLISNTYSYTLPKASTSRLGGVKVGDGLSVNNDGTLTLEMAADDTLGGVKVGTGLAIDDNGVLSMSTTNLPVASDSTLGCVKVGNGLDINNSILSVHTASNSSLGGLKVGNGLIMDNNSIMSVSVDIIKDAMYTAMSKMDRDTTPLDEQYFTIEALDNCKVYWQGNTGFTTNIEYSKDKVNWSGVTLATDDKVLLTELSTLEKLYLRGVNNTFTKYIDRVRHDSRIIIENADFNILGNIMSLVDGPDFINSTGLTEGYCFWSFFANTNVFDASDLIIPDVTLGNGEQFEYMFKNCKKLITAPKLLPTATNYKSYYEMFMGCSSLTMAPEIYATTIASQCCTGMFEGCISLKAVPKIHNTVITDWCYSRMFKDCVSLTTVPYDYLPLDIPADYTGGGCYNSMFEGCIKLTNAPDLPSTVVSEYSYANMFKNCINLVHIPSILPATTVFANYSYSSMFYGCSKITTAPEIPEISKIHYGIFKSMFENCTSLNYVKCLTITKYNENETTANWLKNVASSGTFVKNPNATKWYTNSASGIPSGWTVVDYVEPSAE